MKLILIGIQGAGKSTQGNLISKKYKLPYLSSGHIFRQMAKEKTPWGRYVKETINSGALMPDKKTVEIIEEYLSRDDYKNGYILDGFPRTASQADMFKNGVDMVFYLDVSDKEALWRLSGRVEDGIREDNTLQALRKRIDLFHKHTRPVIDFYKKEKKLVRLDGEQEINDIFDQIQNHIDIHVQSK